MCLDDAVSCMQDGDKEGLLAALDECLAGPVDSVCYVSEKLYGAAACGGPVYKVVFEPDVVRTVMTAFSRAFHLCSLSSYRNRVYTKFLAAVAWFASPAVIEELGLMTFAIPSGPDPAHHPIDYIALNRQFTPEQLRALYNGMASHRPSPLFFVHLARRGDLTPQLMRWVYMEILRADRNRGCHYYHADTIVALFSRDDVPLEVVELVYQYEPEFLLYPGVAHHPAIPAHIIAGVVEQARPYVPAEFFVYLLTNPNCPDEVLLSFVLDDSPLARNAALGAIRERRAGDLREIDNYMEV